MYQVLGLQKVLLGVAVVALAIFVVWSGVSQPSSSWEVVRLLWGSATAAGFLVLLIGQSTPLIPWMARKPWLSGIMPDIDGRWRAELSSNWPVIAKAHGIDGMISTKPVTADVDITVRLLTVRMELLSDTGYSESDTVAVRVLKNQEHGDISLHYIYRNETPVAAGSDSSQHYGAASLRLRGKGTEPLRLEGHYWTNRNWEKGLNTAGRIVMRRT